MHAYHLVARHGEHAEWIVVAEVSFECERKVREVVERLHTVRRDTRRVERFAKMRNLGVGALQRLLQSIELQRRELGARHAFGAAIEHEWRRSIADCSLRRHDLISLSAASWQNPSRFNHRPGNARAAYRYVAKGEALIVSGPRDQNEPESQPAAKADSPAQANASGAAASINMPSVTLARGSIKLKARNHTARSPSGRSTPATQASRLSHDRCVAHRMLSWSEENLRELIL